MVRFVLSACVIALGLGSTGWLIRDGVQNSKEGVRVITVRGFSERIMKADYGTWRMHVRLGGNDHQELETRIEDVRKRLTDFLLSKGLTLEELDFGPRRLSDRSSDWGGYKPEDNRYVVTDTILVKTKKIDALIKSLSSIGELASQGVANFEGDPQFFVTNYDAFRNDMITEAIQGAQKTAVHVVQGTGLRVKGLKTISQGAFSVTGEINNGDTGGTDWQESISPVKKIRVVTTCVFYLEAGQ